MNILNKMLIKRTAFLVIIVVILYLLFIPAQKPCEDYFKNKNMHFAAVVSDKRAAKDSSLILTGDSLVIIRKPADSEQLFHTADIGDSVIKFAGTMLCTVIKPDTSLQVLFLSYPYKSQCEERGVYR